jgi:hypothetical protein
MVHPTRRSSNFTGVEGLVLRTSDPGAVAGILSGVVGEVAADEEAGEIALPESPGLLTIMILR